MEVVGRARVLVRRVLSRRLEATMECIVKARELGMNSDWRMTEKAS